MLSYIYICKVTNFIYLFIFAKNKIKYYLPVKRGKKTTENSVYGRI